MSHEPSTASKSATENTAPRIQNPQMVARGALPFSCPTPEMALWNAHPRVYLPLEADGEATCPYCGARYVLHS